MGTYCVNYKISIQPLQCVEVFINYKGLFKYQFLIILSLNYSHFGRDLAFPSDKSF